MIVLLGKNGLFGQHCLRKYPDIIGLSRADCDITHSGDIFDVIKEYTPTTIINATGIVPKSCDIHDPYKTLLTNALAVKKLAHICSLYGCRLIHLSTNDVFNGSLGGYVESDFVSPTDLYSMSKALGEITEFPHVTVRCSFVGYPDFNQHGLLAWAAGSKKIIGYDKFLWNGLTAVELATVIIERIVPDTYRVGIAHVLGETLSKYDLLEQVKQVYGWDVEILKESDVTVSPHMVDRTLKTEHGLISPKPFKTQLEEMKVLW
jgi:dTDP-4-dehydrorhamnose reductase